MSKCLEILKKIDFRIINKKIVAPCKLAENSYQITYVVPRSYREFQLECANFWNHLNKNFIGYTNVTVPFEQAVSYALAYIDNMVGNQGGTKYAYEECIIQTFAFARNIITEGYIGEARNRYVGAILNTVVDSYDYEEIRKIILEYIKRFNVEIENRGQIAFMIANYAKIFQSHARHHEGLWRERRM